MKGEMERGWDGIKWVVDSQLEDEKFSVNFIPLYILARVIVGSFIFLFFLFYTMVHPARAQRTIYVIKQNEQ